MVGCQNLVNEVGLPMAGPVILSFSRGDCGSNYSSCCTAGTGEQFHKHGEQRILQFSNQCRLFPQTQTILSIVKDYKYMRPNTRLGHFFITGWSYLVPCSNISMPKPKLWQKFRLTAESFIRYIPGNNVGIYLQVRAGTHRPGR